MEKSNNSRDNGWKTQAFVIGTMAGALFGLVSAYLYTRATEEEVVRNGGSPNTIQTGDLLGLGLAALAMSRQVAEMGKPQKKASK